MKQTIVFVSGDPQQESVLKQAGIGFVSVDSGLDEAAVKQASIGDGTSQDIADIASVVAQAKAVSVSEHRPDDWVVAADRVVICEGELYGRPASIDDARDVLLDLSGKSHKVEAAIVCAKNREVIWSYTDTAVMQMRQVSPRFVGRYMAAVGEGVLTTIGGYRVDGLGVQLFEKIDGDHFTVMGLPLLPLLRFLRQQGVIET